MQEETDIRKELFRVRNPRPESACGYTPIPMELVFAYEKMGAPTKLTYFVTLSYSWGKGFCWPSPETLAENCGTSARSIYRHLFELEKEYGLITRKEVYSSTTRERDKYLRTEIAFLPTDQTEIDLALEKLGQVTPAPAVEDGYFFSFEDPAEVSLPFNVSNVLLKGYKGLSPGSKLLFILNRYMATYRLVFSNQKIAFLLGKKDKKFTIRNLSELAETDLIRKEESFDTTGAQLYNHYLIRRYSEEEIRSYLQDVGGTISGNSSELRGISGNNPQEDQDVGGTISGNNPLLPENLAITPYQKWQHNNIIELNNEKDVNVNVDFKIPEQGGEEPATPTSPTQHEKHLERAKRYAEKFNDHKSVGFYVKVTRAFEEFFGDFCQLDMIFSDVKDRLLTGTLPGGVSAGKYFCGYVKKVAEENGINLDAKQNDDSDEAPTQPSADPPEEGQPAISTCEWTASERQEEEKGKETEPSPPPLQQSLFGEFLENRLGNNLREQSRDSQPQHTSATVEYHEIYDELLAMPEEVQKAVRQEVLLRAEKYLPDFYVELVRSGDESIGTQQALKHAHTKCYLEMKETDALPSH